MRFKKYDWDDANIEHIAKHGVTPQEVEEACFNEPFILKARKTRYLVYGRSDNGRYLFMVTAHRAKEAARIVTARDMNASEHKLYNKKRG